jgi:hypothetical protein
MKLIILLSLFVTSAFSAESVLVNEYDVRLYHGTNVHTKFYVDTRASQGYLDLDITERRRSFPPTNCGGQWNPCFPQPDVIYSIFRAKDMVQGLIVENKQLIYRGEQDVVCATLGTTRVLRRLAIYLTGNCKFRTEYDNQSDNLKVYLDIR